MDAAAIALFFAKRAAKQFVDQRERQDLIDSALLAGSGTYRGYSRETGTHSIALPNGEIMRGKFISNAGVEIGQEVAYTKAIGASLAKFKIAVR